MRERVIVAGALVIGIVAVGSLALLSRGHPRLAARVTYVRVLAATEQTPAYVEIGVEPSPVLLQRVKDGETCEYRVAEPGGRNYPVVPSSDEHAHFLRVPYTYGRLPIHPQVEIWLDGERQAATPIASMPPPPASSMTTSSREPIRAFHLPAAEDEALDHLNGRGGIRFASRRPLRSEEWWVITILRTPYQNKVRFRSDEGSAVLRTTQAQGLPTSNPFNFEIARIFYAQDVTAAKVRVERKLHQARSWRIVLSGLKLVEHDGQTALDWSGLKLLPVPGFSLQATPHVPGYQLMPEGTKIEPGSVDPNGDRRAPALKLSFKKLEPPPKFVVQAAPPVKPAAIGGGPPGAVGDDAPISFEKAGLEVSIEGDSLERLNIRSLDLGVARWWAKGRITGPVDRSPFSVTLKVTIKWDEDLGRFEATIPVESAPKS